jgi:hypothetical protein
MRPRSVLALAAFGLAALACGGGGPSSEVDLAHFRTPLVEPWRAMSLPLGKGEVVLSTPEQTAIAYADGSVKDLASQYEAAIVAEGWRETGRSDSAGTVMVAWSREGQGMVLSVAEGVGMVLVSLSHVRESEATMDRPARASTESAALHHR